MKQTLTLDETKRLLGLTAATDTQRGHSENRALMLAVLLCGAKAREWTWEDALSDVINMPFAVYMALRKMACDKQLTIFPFNHATNSAHWIRGAKLQNAVFTATGRKALTTQEVTRRLKRYAVRVGIAQSRMSLRTLANTGVSFANLYGDADLIAELLGLSNVTDVTGRISTSGTARPTKHVVSSVPTPFHVASVQVDRDPRLHGLQRRSSMKTG